MRAQLRWAVLALVAATAPAAAEPVAVTTRVIDEFGSTHTLDQSLRFLGGLVVRSGDDRFGGLSGIDMLGDGTALMVSDAGWAFRARLEHDNGRLSRLTDTALRPLFGAPVPKAEGDAEDIALDPRAPGRGVIVRERRANAMMDFVLREGWPHDLEPRRVGAPNRILRSNRGLESVAYAPEASPLAGEIIAIAERPPRGADDIPGWIAGVGGFSIVQRDGFDITSARFLPNGDLLLLERWFRATSGLAVRLRRIAGDTIAVGARLDGDILLDAGMAAEIDNLEGLAVHEDAEGRTILTIVSDDNFNIFQRTLILQFALVEN